MVSTIDNLEQGWDFFVRNQTGVYSAQTGKQYISNVCDAIDQLTGDMNALNGTSMDPKQLKGFIAEIWHADTFNINAALKNSQNKATVEGSNKFASVDVSTNFDRNYSMKYYATGVKSAQNQAKDVIQAYHEYCSQSKIPDSFDVYITKRGYSDDMTELLKSVYNGQGRIIPSDQLQDAIAYLKKEIAKESSKTGENRTAVYRKYLETLQELSDRIKDGYGAESVPLSKKEAETIAALAKNDDFNAGDFGFTLDNLITPEYLIQQALKAGLTTAIISIALELGPEIYKAISYLINEGEIDAEQLKSLGMKALTSSSEGFLRGTVSAALTISCQTGKLGASMINVQPEAIGAITIIVMDTMKYCCMVACGKMSSTRLAAELSRDVLLSIAAVAGGTIVQTITPELPVLGYLIGSLIGSIMGSLALDISQDIIVSLCVDTGFTLFGLVEQDYSLPVEVLNEFGIKTATYKKATYKTAAYKTTTYKKAEIKKAKYNTINYTVLRRGVIKVNVIGYI